MNTKSLSKIFITLLLFLYTGSVALSFLPHEHKGKITHSASHCLLCQWSQGAKGGLSKDVFVPAASALSWLPFFSRPSPVIETLLGTFTNRSPPESA